MVLNRASRKEAESKLSGLRRQVSLHVFTHRFEDAVCREVRQTAEELAEASPKLSVEISDAAESGDLLRKFRIDSIPAVVVTGKGMPELRMYGIPLLYAFPALIEAVLTVGASVEPRKDLLELFEASNGTARQFSHVDLVVTRKEATCGEAAAAFWRTVAAESACGSCCLVAALRILDDVPRWAVQAGPGVFPTLLVGGKRILSWPFTDTDIAEALVV